MKLSKLSAEISFYCVLSASSAWIFLAPVSRTWYPLIPDPAINFPEHIRHFSFSPLKGIIRIVFSSILVLSCISCQIFTQSSGIILVIQSMLEVSNNLSASSALYTLKGFDVCFNFCLFQYHD